MSGTQRLYYFKRDSQRQRCILLFLSVAEGVPRKSDLSADHPYRRHSRVLLHQRGIVKLPLTAVEPRDVKVKILGASD